MSLVASLDSTIPHFQVEREGKTLKDGAFMLNRLVILVAIFLASLSLHVNVSSGQSSLPPGAHVAGELLVAKKPGVTDTALENIYRGMGAKKIQTFPQIGVHHISVPPQALAQVEAALAKNPSVQFAEKNFLGELSAVANDPLYPSQWHLATTSASGAWDISTGSSNIVVAVTDTGLDTNHPDRPNYVAGWNFVNGNNDIYDNGLNNGHGTAVSGVIAAAGNNGIGVSGVSWRNSIMPLVVMNPSTGMFTYTDLMSAMTYAADHGAKVLSMSLAGPSYSSSLQSAATYAWNKGMVLIAAAGNNASSSPMYPAALDNVVSVSATDTNDAPTSFTNFGNWIDVAAPGNLVYTTMLGGGYGQWWGTSLAAPQVAGLAALIFSAKPSLTNAQVVDLITKNADDLGSPGFDQYYGYGRINLQRSLLAVGSAPSLSAAITSPSSGSTVSGVITVGATVVSQNTISTVELYVDGNLYASDTSSPYSFSFDTTPFTGSHSLMVKAYDTANNTASSPTTSVTVNNTIVTTDTTPPEVQLNSIVYDGRSITATATASDPGGTVVKVEFYVDGILKATDTAAPWSAKINARRLSAGSHVVQAKAYDAAGNSAFSGTGTTTTK